MGREKKRDPLVTVANAGIVVLMVLVAIAALALVVAGLWMLAHPGEISAAIERAGSLATRGQVTSGILAFLLLVLAMIAGAVRFLQLLRQIVTSVGRGDPFVPANADRLMRMGWLALAIELLTMPAEILGYWLGTVLPRGLGGDNWNFSIDGDLEFSVTGIILALVLFILARVFRQGAAMREELEGTV